MSDSETHIYLQEAFQQIIEENKGIVYKIGNSYCKSEEDRKDLIQEIIFQLWKSYPTYNDQYALSTWIYRIALNTAISFYRRSSVRKKTFVPFPEKVKQTKEDGKGFNWSEEVDMLYKFINELKELDRALMLLYLEEKSYQEMAEILGITKTNIATRINRIKKKLKKKFSTLTQS